jgi:hypothetical protein
MRLEGYFVTGLKDMSIYLQILAGTLKVMQGVHVKLNPEFPWQKQQSTRRKIFSPANWN